MLLAICDKDYCFIHINIGQYGSANDSGVLKYSQIGKGFENESFNINSTSKVEVLILELQNRVTQNDFTLRGTNSKIFTEILFFLFTHKHIYKRHIKEIQKTKTKIHITVIR